jgi:MSHA pilin protein MshA
MTAFSIVGGRKAAGFTLIELVVTISIIAVLAAVALPRYITLQTQARAAKAQAIYGGMRSAAALAHAQAIATSVTMSGAATVTMEGAVVDLNNGYPTATNTGILRALQLDATNDQVAVTVANPLIVDMNGGTAGSCTVRYTEPALPNQSPTIAVDTSAC